MELPSGGTVLEVKDDQTRLFRGSKSRNKVSVGEPAEGSLRVVKAFEFELQLDTDLNEIRCTNNASLWVNMFPQGKTRETSVSLVERQSTGWVVKDPVDAQSSLKK